MTHRRSLVALSLLLASCGVTGAPSVTCIPSLGTPPAAAPEATPVPRPTAKPKPVATPVAATGTRTTTRPVPTPTATPTPVPPSPLAAIMEGMRRMWAATQTMKSHVTSWETDGKAVRTQEVDAEVAKPDKMWANILKGSDGATIGTQVHWEGGTTCRISTKFFGFPLKLTMPISDSRLKSLRGWSLADTSIASCFKALLADDAAITYVGQAMFGETKVDVLELQTPALVPGITKERLGVLPDHSSLVLRELFAGDTIVSRSQYAEQEYNITLPPEHWNF